MPKIKEYAAPRQSLHASDRGSQAWETSGRRVGPLHNQAAQDIKEGGRVRGETERAKIWPFNIYALEDSLAPKVRTTTTNETRVRSQDESASLSGGVVAREGWLTDNVPSTDYARQLANAQNFPDDPGYNPTPAPWHREHGEASAGAVGMSRLARSAAKGHGLLSPQNGSVDEDAIKRLGAPPSGDVPLNWQDDPYYTSPRYDSAGHAYTPYQLDKIKERDEQKDYIQKQRDYAQSERERVAAERTQHNIDKWNRQQDQYWNGPTGFNTRRDEWIHGKGGIEDQWQKNYDADKKAQQQIVDHYMKANPNADENDVRQGAYEHRHVRSMSSDGEYSGGDASGGGLWSGAGQWGKGQANEIASAPGAVVWGIKNTFGRMFGNDDEATADIPR